MLAIILYDFFNIIFFFFFINKNRNDYKCFIGSGMSILSMVAYRMITQEGLNRCLKIYDLIENKTIKEETKSNDTTNIETESKLSKSAKRRLRKKKLKDSSLNRNEENIDSSENKSKRSTNDQNTIDVRAYELTNHNTKRSPADFLERSLMAAFLLKCLQRVHFFEDTSRDDGNYFNSN